MRILTAWIGGGLAAVAAIPADAQTAPAHEWRVAGLLFGLQGTSALLLADVAGTAGPSATKRRLTLRMVFERPLALGDKVSADYVDYRKEIDCPSHMIRGVGMTAFAGGKQILDSQESDPAQPYRDNEAGRAAAAACSGDWSALPAVVGTTQAEAASRFSQRAALARSAASQNWYSLGSVGAKPDRRMGFLDRDSIVPGAGSEFDTTMTSLYESGERASDTMLFRVRIDCAALTVRLLMGISYLPSGEVAGAVIEPRATESLKPGSDPDVVAGAQCLKKWDAKYDAHATLGALRGIAFP